MRLHYRVLALMLLLLVTRDGAAGQSATGPVVDPGDVATIVLTVPASPGVDSARYTLELEPGYRSFVPLAAAIARTDDTFIVPVIFATPPSLPAGEQRAGRVSVMAEGLATRTHPVLVNVREHRKLVFELEVDQTTVAPDALVSVPFRLHNRGNIGDTIQISGRMPPGWTLVESPRLVLSAGDSALGSLSIAAPPDASPGERELVVLTARSSAADQSRSVGVVVVSATGWLDGYEAVPSAVFVGRTMGGSHAPVLALTAGGPIGSDTEVRLDVRSFEAGAVDPSLQRQMAGPRLRLAVVRPDLSVEAGQVQGYATTFTGTLRHSRGVRVEFEPPGPLGFRASAAVPVAYSGNRLAGHDVYGEMSLATGRGPVEALAGDRLASGRGAVPSTRSSGAGLRWRGGHGLHSFSIEATAARFSAADSLVRHGGAVDARYQLDAGLMSTRVRLRRVPDAASVDGSAGNQFSASLTARLRRNLQLAGWLFDNSRHDLASGSRTASRTGNLSLRTRLGAFQLQLGGNLSGRKTSTPLVAGEQGRSTVSGDVLYSRGRLMVQSEMEWGRAWQLDRDGRYQSVSTSFSWREDGHWGWAGIRRTSLPGGATTTSIDAGGTLEVGVLEATGGISTTLSNARRSTAFWSTTELKVHRGTSVFLGASVQPVAGRSPWTFSLGVRRRLTLPLPIARQPELRGVVFEDRNGSGTREVGEPPVPDVVLALGYLETSTDADGAFSFRDGNGTPLRVRPEDLPDGLVLPAQSTLPSRGYAAIPLVRTAALELELFMDRDGDGGRDLAESAGAAVELRITDERGQGRNVTADQRGRVRIERLLPGRYTIAGPADGDEEREVLLEITLAPGAEAHHTLAVPLRRRTIRMQGDGGAFPWLRQL